MQNNTDEMHAENHKQTQDSGDVLKYYLNSFSKTCSDFTF